MPDTDNKLAVIQQRDVVFYDDSLTAVRAEDGRIYAGLTQMCNALGIDAQGQRQRIDRHTILSRGLMVCNLHTIQGDRDSYVLRADLVPLWLSGIRTKSVNEANRAKLEKFQEEAAAVLWEAFQEGRLTADTRFDELLQQTDSPSVQAYQMAMAVVRLARQQIMLEGRLGDTEVRLDDVEERLTTVEGQLTGGDAAKRVVTEAQASQVSQAVKAVALALGKQTGRNEFGGVYGELYRKFGITSYKMLPASKFDAAMAFLSEWHQQLTGEAPF